MALSEAWNRSDAAINHACLYSSALHSGPLRAQDTYGPRPLDQPPPLLMKKFSYISHSLVASEYLPCASLSAVPKRGNLAQNLKVEKVTFPTFAREP